MNANYTNTPSLPIGMFDSGVGGLTVMREVMRSLPYETIYYFGDTAHFPYGNQSSEAIIAYSRANAHFLLEQKIKLLVIACNTASAQALSIIKDLCPIPVIDVISAGVEKITSLFQRGSIAILGTKGTIRAGVYQQQIKEKAPNIQIYPLACPLLAPLVEEQFTHHPAANLIVEEYLKPLRDKDLDAVLLGCTHYPFLIDHIRAVLGDDVQIVDSASACAWMIEEELKKNDLLAPPAFPSHHYFVTSDWEEFQRTGGQFLQQCPSNISLIEDMQKVLMV